MSTKYVTLIKVWLTYKTFVSTIWVILQKVLYSQYPFSPCKGVESRLTGVSVCFTVKMRVTLSICVIDLLILPVFVYCRFQIAMARPSIVCVSSYISQSRFQTYLLNCIVSICTTINIYIQIYAYN